MRNFVLGTDWWTDCDDVVAVRILSRAHKAGQICLKGIEINACMEYSAPSLEGFLNTECVCDVLVGIDREATDYGRNPPYQKRLSKYAQKIKNNDDAEDSVRLYRRILAESEEKVEVLEIGFLQAFAALLCSGADDISDKTGMELVEEKVSKMWIMAGKWDEELGKEYNFANTDRSRIAAAYVCENCPVPITFLGFEVGVDVISGGLLAENDVLHQAMSDHGSGNGRSSWDPMLACLALCGDETKAGYDCVIGNASVDPKTGANTFEPYENGKHRFVVKKYENEYYRDMINEMIK